MAYTDGTERESDFTDGHVTGWTRFTDGGWWQTEPGVGRVANGIPHRVDRIKCLGNAVVPAQFYPIFWAIANIERILSDEKI